MALRTIAGNCRKGPFTATSGIELPYLLAAATNLFDRQASGAVLKVFAAALAKIIERLQPEGDIVIVGPEMAGGVMTAQLALLTR